MSSGLRISRRRSCPPYIIPDSQHTDSESDWKYSSTYSDVTIARAGSEPSLSSLETGLSDEGVSQLRGHNAQNTPPSLIPDQRPARVCSRSPSTAENQELSVVADMKRQGTISRMIMKGSRFFSDLIQIDLQFLRPLQKANPSVMPPSELIGFCKHVAGNIADLLECHSRTLGALRMSETEQRIRLLCDAREGAHTKFSSAYPIYAGHLPSVIKRLKDEDRHNPAFRSFLERWSEVYSLDIYELLNRPLTHLDGYPAMLREISGAMTDPQEVSALEKAIESVQEVNGVACLWVFQACMGQGPSGEWTWQDFLSPKVRVSLSSEEADRQQLVFSFITDEMQYVQNLENIDLMYRTPLRTMEPPLIHAGRFLQFGQEVFHNFAELHLFHRTLLNDLHEVQRKEYPLAHSITAVLCRAVLRAGFRDAYLDYIPNIPIAMHSLDEEAMYNPGFVNFIRGRALPPEDLLAGPAKRLIQYENYCMLSARNATLEGEEDRELFEEARTALQELRKETEEKYRSAMSDIAMRQFKSRLSFSRGDDVDMQLLNENDSIIHSGILYPQDNSHDVRSIFALLTESCLILTDPKEIGGHIRYHIQQRPLALDLLTIAQFTDQLSDSGTTLVVAGGRYRTVFSFTFRYEGTVSLSTTLFADSQHARELWMRQLVQAIQSRKMALASSRIFEPLVLNFRTSYDAISTGATCAAPFTAASGREYVIIGNAAGVWVWMEDHHYVRCWDVGMVEQCAILEEFNVLLVLAEQTLFARRLDPASYHPSLIGEVHMISAKNSVQFFSTGTQRSQPSTLVMYMERNGSGSDFYVLELMAEKMLQKAPQSRSFGSRLGLRSSPRSEWFAPYKYFNIQQVTFEAVFLPDMIAIMCTKMVKLVNLDDLSSVRSISTQYEDPLSNSSLVTGVAPRPIGIFQTSRGRYLLCFDERGIFLEFNGRAGVLSSVKIEWAGRAKRAAFHPPYVLLFADRFIEVRHVETGRLVQLIPANNVRFLWAAQAATSRPASNYYPDEWQAHNISRRPQVIGVMDVIDPLSQPNSGSEVMATVHRNIFQLAPAIPLYLYGDDQYVLPIGVVRLCLHKVTDVKDIATTTGGKCDLYVQVLANNVTQGRTDVVDISVGQEWDEIVYVPVHSLKETIILDCVYSKPPTKVNLPYDVTWSLRSAQQRSVGYVELRISDLARPSAGQYRHASAGKRVAADPIKRNEGALKSCLHYEAEFIPALPVKVLKFSTGLNRVAQNEDDSRTVIHDAMIRTKVNSNDAATSAESIATAVAFDSAAVEDRHRENESFKLSKDELLNHASGVMIMNVICAQLQKKARLEVLFDDAYWPAFSTVKAQTTNVRWAHIGEGVIRELDFCRVCLRLNGAEEGEKDVYAQYKVDAKTFLDKTLDGPAIFTFFHEDDPEKISTVEIETRYVPVPIVLKPRESIDNQGMVSVELVDGSGFDRENRFVSFAVVTFALNGQQVYKSQRSKNMYAPMWSERFYVAVPSRLAASFTLEVFDWKQFGQAESLGIGNISLIGFEPFEAVEKIIPLSSYKHGEKGSIRLRLLLQPEFIPKTRAKTSTLPARVEMTDTDRLGIETANKGALRVTVLDAKDLSSSDVRPYVHIRIGDKYYKTKYVAKTATPEWNESFMFEAAPATQTKLHARIYDHKALGQDKELGQADIDLWRHLQPHVGISAADVAVELQDGQGLLRVRLELDSESNASILGSRSGDSLDRTPSAIASPLASRSTIRSRVDPDD